MQHDATTISLSNFVMYELFCHKICYLIKILLFLSDRPLMIFIIRFAATGNHSAVYFLYNNIQ
jgi:hypothetical protein